VTALCERDLHEGALAAHAGALFKGEGSRREYLVVCVDNRDGRDELRFDPARGTLRLVTDAAGGAPEQVEMSPQGEASAEVLKAAPELGEAVAQASALTVLPGVVRNVIAAFPEGTDFSRVEWVYWGERDPWRLGRKTLAPEDLERIRRTLR
jgi:hypothetical protein